MASTMLAAQYDKASDRILIHHIPIPTPTHNQLLVKLTAASLCHSDLMTSLRPSPSPSFRSKPITIGHEGVGTITSLHPSIPTSSGLAIGSRIGMFYITDCCFSCPGCTLHGTFCNNPPTPAIPGDPRGPKIQGLQSDGFFAEYAVVDYRNAIPLPEALLGAMERLSPVFCAGVTAFHAVNKCGLRPGQTVAVVGCGGLGQLGVRYAKAMGLRVVAVDVSQETLGIVGGLGADLSVNPSVGGMADVVRRARKFTGARGVDAACVFSDATAAYATAQRILTFGGVLMVVGMPGKKLEFEPMALSLGLVQVRGASNGTVAEVGEALEFTARHKIVPEVEFRRLEEMPAMWEEMRTGKARRRMVVRFDGNEKRGSRL